MTGVGLPGDAFRHRGPVMEGMRTGTRLVSKTRRQRPVLLLLRETVRLPDGPDVFFNNRSTAEHSQVGVGDADDR